MQTREYVRNPPAGALQQTSKHDQFGAAHAVLACKYSSRNTAAGSFPASCIEYEQRGSMGIDPSLKKGTLLSTGHLSGHYQLQASAGDYSVRGQGPQDSEVLSAPRLSVLRHGLQDPEVIREGLACAPRVIDGHRHRAAGSQGEGHGHAVVIIGVDGRALDLQVRMPGSHAFLTEGIPWHPMRGHTERCDVVLNTQQACLGEAADSEDVGHLFRGVKAPLPHEHHVLPSYLLPTPAGCTA
eukprot:1144916-Pelagomonas_calceolata.AAC.5